jgi:alpha-L-arabinofuranosidase
MIYFARGDGGVGVWNLGGWNNTLHGLDLTGNPERIAGKIEDNRWYDVRIELQGATVKAYLDNQLVQQGQRQPQTALYAIAGRDEKNGEVILDVVNPTSQARTATINLSGADLVATTAKASVLSGAPGDENSVQEPTKVAPREETITGVKANFSHTFPAHSFTVLRLKAR